MLAALLLLGSSVLDVIQPGSAVLDTAKIRVGVDTLLVLVPQGENVAVAALMRMETTLDSTSGAPTLRRHEKTFIPNGTTLHNDRFTVDRATLAPLRQASDGVEGGTQMDTFDGLAFYANSMDMVLSALPLTEGYTADLALVMPDSEAQVTRIEVTTDDPVVHPLGGPCEAWRVDVTNDTASDGTYWISTEGRGLLRYIPNNQALIVVRQRGCAISS